MQILSFTVLIPEHGDCHCFVFLLFVTVMSSLLTLFQPNISTIDLMTWPNNNRRYPFSSLPLQLLSIFIKKNERWKNSLCCMLGSAACWCRRDGECPQVATYLIVISLVVLILSLLPPTYLSCSCKPLHFSPTAKRHKLPGHSLDFLNKIIFLWNAAYCVVVG